MFLCESLGKITWFNFIFYIPKQAYKEQHVLFVSFKFCCWKKGKRISSRFGHNSALFCLSTPQNLQWAQLLLLKLLSVVMFCAKQVYQCWRIEKEIDYMFGMESIGDKTLIFNKNVQCFMLWENELRYFFNWRQLDKVYRKDDYWFRGLESPETNRW